MKTIAIVGTFDTKGSEYAYIKELIESQGIATFTVHIGAFVPTFAPDISNATIAEAGGVSIQTIVAKRDRALATATMAAGIEKVLPELYRQGKFDGVISMGGSGGTSMIAPAMRALPIGVPKLIVSTVASGNTAMYVGTSDIMMVPSVVDVSGLNSFSCKILGNAAFAVAGMVKFETHKELPKKPLVAATMFGVTTPCVNMAREYMEQHGYEVLVFHATGTGGKSMEALVDAGFIKGVLDITTTEWADELIGGILAAGPHRNEAAARKGIPQIVSVGALDMCNFGPYDTVPKEFAGRNLYRHNPTTTLMRTNVEENRRIGKKLVEKLNLAKGKTALFLPLKGVSMIDVEGQPFYGPAEDNALFDTLRAGINRKAVNLVEMDYAINDRPFAEAMAQRLLDLMEQ